MSNQNVVWVVQYSENRLGPWTTSVVGFSREKARKEAQNTLANYTRVRKYIDSGDKT